MDQGTPLIEEIRRKVRALDRRDLQLWAINALVILAVAAGLAGLMFPDVVWHVKTPGLDGRYSPQLFLGFIVLIVLLNAYILEQRRLLLSTRAELLRQVLRTEAAEKFPLIDPTTEIFNRRYLDKILSREVSNADRQKSSLTFLFVDVDAFKSVNTRYGQLVGDHLLNSVAQLLLETFRRSDTVIRYGGDEFLILLPETNEKQAQGAVERLLKRVDRWNRESSLPGYTLSLSCGIATYTKGESVSELLDAGEQRMHFQRSARSASR